MYALFNFDQTSSLHALIRACTLINFSGFLKDFCLKIMKLNLVKSLALFSHNTLCFKEIMRDFLSSVMIDLRLLHLHF